jgi:hypothetical protein
MKWSILMRFGTFLVFFGCSETTPEPVLFGAPVAVTINKYSGNLMEPFFSRDSKYLFFNNLNRAPENTNLHWATRKDDKTFDYQGEIAGVNTDDIEGTPSMDNTNNFYFVSTRNYATLLSTIYVGTFSNGTVTNVSLVPGISMNQAGTVNFDVEINTSGDTMYFVDGQFDDAGHVVTADLVIARKTAGGFERAADSGELLKNVNSPQLEYAASISSDNLELYFTRASAPLDQSSTPQIFIASRQTENDPFGTPMLIKGLGEFVEAPSISSQGKLLYYHKLTDANYSLFLAKH